MDLGQHHIRMERELLVPPGSRVWEQQDRRQFERELLQLANPGLGPMEPEVIWQAGQRWRAAREWALWPELRLDAHQYRTCSGRGCISLFLVVPARANEPSSIADPTAWPHTHSPEGIPPESMDWAAARDPRRHGGKCSTCLGKLRRAFTAWEAAATLRLSGSDRAQDRTEALAALQAQEPLLLRRQLQEEEFLVATGQLLQLCLYEHDWISAKEEAVVLYRYMQTPARDKLWQHLRALDEKRFSIAPRLQRADELRRREQRVCWLLGAASRTTLLRSRLGVGVADASIALPLLRWWIMPPTQNVLLCEVFRAWHMAAHTYLRSIVRRWPYLFSASWPWRNPPFPEPGWRKDPRQVPLPPLVLAVGHWVEAMEWQRGRLHSRLHLLLYLRDEVQAELRGDPFAREPEYLHPTASSQDDEAYGLHWAAWRADTTAIDLHRHMLLLHKTVKHDLALLYILAGAASWRRATGGLWAQRRRVALQWHSNYAPQSHPPEGLYGTFRQPWDWKQNIRYDLFFQRMHPPPVEEEVEIQHHRCVGCLSEEVPPRGGSRCVACRRPICSRCGPLQSAPHVCAECHESGRARNMRCVDCHSEAVPPRDGCTCRTCHRPLCRRCGPDCRECREADPEEVRRLLLSTEPQPAVPASSSSSSAPHNWSKCEDCPTVATASCWNCWRPLCDRCLPTCSHCR